MKKVFSLLMIAATMYACNEPGKTDSVVETKVTNVKTFENVKVAFAEGYKQSAEGTFTFPSAVEDVKQIKMYLKDSCPNKSCDEWDRYANIYAKDKETGVWYEIGRFITPYWVGTEKLERGLEFDVTDFKSLLSGATELKIYTETWLAKGRTYSLEFDFIHGTPDYKYSTVVPVMQYNQSSLHGVPYGEPHSFELKKTINIPTSAEVGYLRTIITGWGHSSPNNCAEWCFRTHHVALDGELFAHELKSLGCANNPINNQAPGNWRPNRAGWCPGMVVPVRFDNIAKTKFGKNISFEYQFADYTNDMSSGRAFYAISTFVVLKSNQPIQKATITSAM